jgi:glutamate N-acetyltransferase / amino-acid N-acetyltransferase
MAMAGTLPISPLAPERFPDFQEIEGVRLAAAKAGIKYPDRTDVLLVAFDPGTVAAGVLTRSKCAGAPVEWCRQALSNGAARGLLVNSGNANAFTGNKGREAVHHSASLTAAAIGCKAENIYLASTGVIGEPLDARKFDAVMGELVEGLEPVDFELGARAIMTTDTFPKGAFRTVLLGETPVRIAGIAKGSGMIAPDMATTLAFVFTDAPIAGDLLQVLLSDAVTDTFNAITVDSDTSTSDTLLMFATGKARTRGAPAISLANDPRLAAFRAALIELLLDLACQVVRDGEGARKFVTVEVTGAETKEAARNVARAIANSPLVKTAVAGEDANWGRVVMAVGKSGERVDRDRLSIHFGAVCVATEGARNAHYDEAAASAHMRRSDIDIRVDLGIGPATDRVYTCDLTAGYVEINGDYRS